MTTSEFINKLATKEITATVRKTGDWTSTVDYTETATGETRVSHDYNFLAEAGVMNWNLNYPKKIVTSDIADEGKDVTEQLVAHVNKANPSTIKESGANLSAKSDSENDAIFGQGNW